MKPTRLIPLFFILLVSLGLIVLGLSAAQAAASAAPRLPQAPDLAFVYTSTNVPLPFPGDQCATLITSTIFIPEDYQIADLNLGIAIQHGDRTNLHINLVSPSGHREVIIFEPTSASATNINALMDDESGLPYDSDGSPHTLLPRYSAATWNTRALNLLAYNMEQTAGTWALEVCDQTMAGPGGTLLDWTLFFDAAPNFSLSYFVGPAKEAWGNPLEYEVHIQNSGVVDALGTIVTTTLPANAVLNAASLLCPDAISCSYAPPPTHTITWNGDIAYSSEAVIYYSLTPNPGTYGPYDNTAVIYHPLAGSKDLFTRAYAAPVVYGNANFESGTDGFYIPTGSINNQWFWGIDTNGPAPFHSGPTTWSTSIAGAPYPPGNMSTLVRDLDLRDLDPRTPLAMQWWDWYDFDDDGGDIGRIIINGDVLYSISGNSAPTWNHHIVDLSPYVGQYIEVKWILISDNDAFTGYGWHIDEVSLHTTATGVDLAIAKIDQVDPVFAGELLTYTISVTNTGPEIALGTTVIDYLPPEVIFVTSAPDPTACALTNQSVVCDLGDLPTGMSTSLELVVSTSATTPPGFLQNTAWVTSDIFDTNIGNNQTTIETLIIQAENTAPQIFSVTPSFGLNTSATDLVIIGQNFATSAAVYLDNIQLTSVTFIDSLTLHAVVPSGLPPRTYSLSVINPDAQTAKLLDAFTVIEDAPPQIESISPVWGLNDLPVVIHIYGSNFSPDLEGWLAHPDSSQVDLDYINYVDATHLRAVVPISIPTGTYSLTLLSPLTSLSDTLPSAYTAIDPATYDDLTAFDFGLWLGPPSPEAGETTAAGLVVRRYGGSETLNNVEVLFTLHGEPLGTSVIETLDPRSGTLVTLTWPAPDVPGLYQIVAHIDPNNLVDEANEGNNVFTRTLRVRPYTPFGTPTILTFTVDGGNLSTTDRQVSLDIEAENNPAWLYYVEYIYDTSTDDWLPVKQSGWLTYTEAYSAYEWLLTPVPGAHYLQAWIANQAGNIAPLPARTLINYIPFQARIAIQEGHIYRAPFTSGETILVRLTSLLGDADLIIWGPGGVEIGRSETGNAIEEIQFTATADGWYQIEVEGYTSTEYRLQVYLTEPTLAALDLLSPDSPLRRGRDQPFTTEIPSDKIGLPAAPVTDLVYYFFLPGVYRTAP
ncbi:MAG: DUF11 domain-containing protein [Anaerolineales bacterium]|nr:DUF11 domain-containing protein [Anaerolineales bacterium]